MLENKILQIFFYVKTQEDINIGQPEISIENARPETRLGQRQGKIQADVRFSYTAFSARDGYDSGWTLFSQKDPLGIRTGKNVYAAVIRVVFQMECNAPALGLTAYFIETSGNKFRKQFRINPWLLIAVPVFKEAFVLCSNQTDYDPFCMRVMQIEAIW